MGMQRIQPRSILYKLMYPAPAFAYADYVESGGNG